jgi:hypothetical protein
MIQEITPGSRTAPQGKAGQKASVSRSADRQQTPASEDRVALGTSGNNASGNTGIYRNPKAANAQEVARLKQQAEAAKNDLRKLVEELLRRQGKSLPADSPLIDSETIGKAKEAISDDGDYGIEAVSDRIVQFAIAVSGDDKTRFEELKAAIDEGFAAARELLGGALPEISQKTYEATMKKLEQWRDGSDE